MCGGSEPAAPRGVEGDDDGGGWSEERTAVPLIYRDTSGRLHLQKQSHPPLIDVGIIELSPRFPCFSSSLIWTPVILSYFALTPFATKDVPTCIYVNILPDGCQRDGEAPRRPGLTTGLSGLINLGSRASRAAPQGSARQLLHPDHSVTRSYVAATECALNESSHHWWSSILVINRLKPKEAHTPSPPINAANVQ